MNEAKENWMSEQCLKVEKAIAKGDSKEAYQTIKVLTKSQQPKTSVIEDRKGKSSQRATLSSRDGLNTAMTCTTTS